MSTLEERAKEWLSGPVGGNPLYLYSATPSILDDAIKAVYGDREKDYSHPKQNMRATAALVNGLMDALGAEFRFKPEHIPLLMLAVKEARLLSTPNHRDSVVDLAGWSEVYARTVGMDD